MCSRGCPRGQGRPRGLHLCSSPLFPQYMSDLPEQKLKTNFTFQNFLQHVFKNLSNIKKLKYGTQSQLK